MLTVRGLSRSFGGQTIFDGANWFVPERDRVGLVGANGSGKSTLLRLIAGLDHPDSGEISVPRGVSAGYLPQEGLEASGRTVLAEALQAFANALELEKECRRLEQALSDADPSDPSYEALLADYTRARERWDTEGSYDHESQARGVLAGLGFRPQDFERDAGTFSGGWQMRLALAKLLLQQPGLLLLDEPTNHLDLEARNWLEEFLKSYPSMVILVAHDRYFLDVTVNRITEVSRGKLTDYPMSYTRYLAEREERRAKEIEAYRLQQEEISRIEAFVSRFRYQASKAALVQSRIKFLEKLDRLPQPDGVTSTIHFRFPPCQRSGRIVLRLEDVHKRYGNVVVYEGLDLTIERGKKVALVGPNGAGKSTLIKLLAGVEPPSSGARELGHNVTLGYFAQDQTQVLQPDQSVLEAITAVSPFEVVPRLRSVLGAFLFSGDTVHKLTKVLSGGERNRLALAMLLLQPSNCLLLDEPTNHLDIAAKEVLMEALQHYKGTLVLVAHDRYLLDGLAEEVIEVGAGHTTRYLGNYEDYLLQKAAGGDGVTLRSTPSETELGGPTTATPRDTSRDAAKRAARGAARIEREVSQLEESIAEKENELATLSDVINAPDFYTTHEDPHGVFSRYARLKRDVDGLYGKLADRLERLEKEAGGRDAQA
jgi:ATP-binding cassette subfamily F protein 3